MTFSLSNVSTDASSRRKLDSLLFAPIGHVGRLLANGSISATELCRQVLGAASERDPALGGYSQLIEDSALNEAQVSDNRRKTNQVRSPIDGIPIAIKDLIDTHPAVCSAGLYHLANYVPTEDAAVVAGLRRSGAVIIGVTETDPGAFSTDTPQTINPLDPSRTVGGSSGGSAAVVAAGLAFVGIGTDSGGSIRIPAACCSLVGFKPTWGRLSMAGVRPLAPSLDHLGPLTRSVQDTILMQSALDDALEPVGEYLGPLTLGTSYAYFEDADPDVQASVRTAIENLRSTGIEVREVELPAPDQVLAFHRVNLHKEAAEYHARMFPDAWQTYPEDGRATVEAGLKTTAADYASAERRRAQAHARVDLALDVVDAIVLPTMPMDAPLRSARDVALGKRVVSKLAATIRYTALFNQTGHPVVAMPGSLLPDGRALSIQLVGKRHGDANLLAIARRVERCLAVHVDYARLGELQRDNAQLIRTEITSSS